jgi:hypothetical protein
VATVKSDYADGEMLASQVIGGSQLAVAPSYQISWGSTPWNSAGIWDGLTFCKQFEKAFQVWLQSRRSFYWGQPNST